MARTSPTKKKSPAQLDREIAAALSRKPGVPSRTSVHATTAKRPKTKNIFHARRGNDEKQTQVLMVANDAALSSQYDRAEKLLSQGPQRAIATAFTTVTPESAEAGDYASRGWEDKDGDDIEVDVLDIEEQVDASSHTPVTDAIVTKAVQWLDDHGATETSSTSFHPGVWYETEFEADYSSGEEKQEEFFLRNFTPEEERKIFDTFNRRR